MQDMIIHENEEIIKLVIDQTKEWLSNVGLEISEEKTKLRKASQSFDFLGFNIILVKRQNQYRTKIIPSKENQRNIIEKTSEIISRNKLHLNMQTKTNNSWLEQLFQIL